MLFRYVFSNFYVALFEIFGFVVLGLDELRKSLDVGLRHQKSLDFGHLLFGVQVRDDLSQSFKCIVETVHPFAFSRVGSISSVSKYGRGRWVQILLSSSPSLSRGLCIRWGKILKLCLRQTNSFVCVT